MESHERVHTGPVARTAGIVRKHTAALPKPEIGKGKFVSEAVTAAKCDWLLWLAMALLDEHIYIYIL